VFKIGLLVFSLFQTITMIQMQTRPHGVLIVEDMPETCQRLKNALDRAPDLAVVGCVGTLAQGLAALREHQPRVVLVDIGLPDGSGIKLVEQVVAASWQAMH